MKNHVNNSQLIDTEKRTIEADERLTIEEVSNILACEGPTDRALEALFFRDGQVAREAIWSIVEDATKSIQWTPILIQLLESENWMTRLPAVNALITTYRSGYSGIRPSNRTLGLLSGDECDTVRGDAVELIMRTTANNDRSTKYAHKFILDPSENVRVALLDLSIDLLPPTILTTIISRGLFDPSYRVLTSACRLTARSGIHAHRFSDRLSALKHKTDPELQSAAEQALDSIQDERGKRVRGGKGSRGGNEEKGNGIV